jgi:imidazolonepropionase-like amidohydrolase
MHLMPAPVNTPPPLGTSERSGRTTVTCGTLLDGAGGEPLEGATLVIDADRIVDLLVPGQAIPSADRHVDLRHAFVLPGLVDAHMHFLGVPSNEEYHRLHVEPESIRALRAAVEAQRMLLAGVTSARCLGSSIGPALARAVREGVLAGPRIVAAGKFICATDGTWDHTHLPLEMVREQGIVADGAEGVRAMVRQRMREGATVIKLGLSKAAVGDTYHAWGDDPFAQVVCYSADEVKAAVEEAHAHGVKVSAHCIGSRAVRLALVTGVDVIEHGYAIDEETRQLVLQHDALLVSTLSQLHFHVESAVSFGYPTWLGEVFARHWEAMQADFERSVKAGVRYALGTDLVGLPTHPLDRAPHELSLAVGLGMTPSQAIHAGTLVAAEALGWQDHLGSIEVGKLADVIAVPRDPTIDIGALQHVLFVMQGGRIHVTP